MIGVRFRGNLFYHSFIVTHIYDAVIPDKTNLYILYVIWFQYVNNVGVINVNFGGCRRFDKKVEKQKFRYTHSSTSDRKITFWIYDLHKFWNSNLFKCPVVCVDLFPNIEFNCSPLCTCSSHGNGGSSAQSLLLWLYSCFMFCLSLYGRCFNLLQ